ncbi:MAG: sensor histidine kinase [Bacteroidetes bacterium]|nr:sensor histidine kinase [Bacteroidota bacterium]
MKRAIAITLARFKDLTELRQVKLKLEKSLNDKETLLKEIHHRVKNNMTIISSLLKLQLNIVDDEKAKEALQDSQNRVQTMSMIHETLYRSEDMSSIDMQTYLPELGRTIFQSYIVSDNVNLKVEAENIIIGVKQLSPIGLIVNELITNSLKYAFPDNQKGEVKIILQKREDQIELEYSDNGIGIQEDFDWKNTKSMGLNLVKILAENQLDGSIDMESENGTKFTIKFNIET